MHIFISHSSKNAEPAAKICECYCVNLSLSDKRIVAKSVGLKGFGIRPAMTIDLSADCVKKAPADSRSAD